LKKNLLIDLLFQGAGGAKFRESIVMGEFKGTLSDIQQIISSLNVKYGGNCYHILNRNCNHFANDFMLRLINKPIPDYVNRLAFYGSIFSCLLPNSMTNNAPVENSNSVGNKNIGRNNHNNNNALPPSKNAAYLSGSGQKLGRYNTTFTIL
jgi:deubiquitinase DESI2